MGYNISDVSGNGVPQDTTPEDPDDWVFTADLSSPSVTTITGDFDAQFDAPDGDFGEAGAYSNTPLSTTDYGTLTLDPVTGQFTFVIDRAAVIASGTDQIVTFTITGTTLFFSDTDTVTLRILICVAAGTRIATDAGETRVEALTPGDRVRLADGRVETIRWIGSRAVSPDEMARNPSLVPVVIRKDAFGPGRPARDLSVSPQHRVLVEGPAASLHFGEDAVLVPAKGLVDGVRVIRARAAAGVEYFHILFDRHEIMLTEGLPTESFLPGEHSLGALDRATRDEILALFPDLAGGPAMTAAFPGIRPWEARLVTGAATARV